jgi:hypothetical protein
MFVILSERSESKDLLLFSLSSNAVNPSVASIHLLSPQMLSS